jgi:tryptophan synthase alpha chain
MPVDHLLQALKEFGAPPALLGFGISEPEQVKAAIAAGAAGAISGSAVVKIIEQNLAEPAVMLEKLTTFVKSMKAATLR